MLLLYRGAKTLTMLWWKVREDVSMAFSSRRDNSREGKGGTSLYQGLGCHRLARTKARYSWRPYCIVVASATHSLSMLTYPGPSDECPTGRFVVHVVDLDEKARRCRKVVQLRLKSRL